MSVLQLSITERILVGMRPGRWYNQKELAALGNCDVNSISGRMRSPARNGLVVINRATRPMRIRLADGDMPEQTDNGEANGMTKTEQLLHALQALQDDNPGRTFSAYELAESTGYSHAAIYSLMQPHVNAGKVVEYRNARPMRYGIASDDAPQADADARPAHELTPHKPNPAMLREGIERAKRFLEGHGYRVTRS